LKPAFYFSYVFSLLEEIIHVLLPVRCAGCGREISYASKQWLCYECVSSLPATDYHLVPLNPVFQLFMHHPEVKFATACYFFHHDGILQRIIHQIKYQHHQQLAGSMGRLMARMLKPWLASVDYIIPVPLHPRKEQQRGYNQAAILAYGMADDLQKPVIHHLLRRKKFTETQTRKGRQARQQNVQHAFQLTDDAHALTSKHLLLIDDVVTTGATLNACIDTLIQLPGVQISIATLAIAES